MRGKMNQTNFQVKKHSGINPEQFPKKFVAQHLSPYHFVVPTVRGKDVLEIGFGDGYGAYFLKDYAQSVTAVDLFQENVSLAQEKYKGHNLSFAQMNAICLAFEDDWFDAVVSFQVIEHVPRHFLKKYLLEMKRVLKPGGTAFITTLNLEKNMKPGNAYNKSPDHDVEFTEQDFNQLLSGVFDKTQIYGLFPTPKHAFFERLKKWGIKVNAFYNSIGVKDFVWKKNRTNDCLDFMAICSK